MSVTLAKVFSYPGRKRRMVFSYALASSFSGLWFYALLSLADGLPQWGPVFGGVAVPFSVASVAWIAAEARAERDLSRRRGSQPKPVRRRVLVGEVLEAHPRRVGDAR